LFQGDGLGSEADRFQSWRADLIDGGAGNIETDASSHWNLPSWSLPDTRAEYVTQNDLVDFLGVEVDGFEDALDCELAEFGRVEGGEPAVETADGRPFGSDDVDRPTQSFRAGEEVLHMVIINNTKMLFYLRWLAIGKT
jgi:hypothetical protein